VEVIERLNELKESTCLLSTSVLGTSPLERGTRGVSRFSESDFSALIEKTHPLTPLKRGVLLPEEGEERLNELKESTCLLSTSVLETSPLERACPAPAGGSRGVSSFSESDLSALKVKNTPPAPLKRGAALCYFSIISKVLSLFIFR